MTQPIDTTEKRLFFEVEGTDYLLVIDKHPNDDELLSAARYEIYFINKQCPDFHDYQVEPEQIRPMSQLMSNTLMIMKLGFKLEQDGVELE